MVILEFKCDNLAIEKAGEHELDKVDSALFSNKLFIMPVHLRVDDVELLEMSTQFGRLVTQWPFLPVVDVATYGLEKLYDAWQNGHSEIWVSEIGLRLTLDREDDSIKMHSHNMGRVCSAPYIELRQAFEDFAKRVRETLTKEAPELQNHPYWGPWFRGEVKTPWRDWKEE